MKGFLDLKATQVALDLVEEIFQLCRKLPREELYGLSSQLKSASSSIVANIAEGFGRFTFDDKANKYVIARGECTEVVAHLHVAVRVHYLQATEIRQALHFADETGRILSGLIAACRRHNRS
jgi:four helix bundle protein